MFIIGINGKPGSGKTTISKELLNNQDVYIIHLDYLFNNVKFKLTRNPVLRKNNDGEVFVVLNKKKLSKRILDSKHIGKIAHHILGSVALANKIRTAKKSGIKYLIIEGFNLENYLDTNSLDFSIKVSVDESLRNERLIKRDGRNNLEELVEKYPITNSYDVEVKNDNGYIPPVSEIDKMILEQSNNHNSSKRLAKRLTNQKKENYFSPNL